MSDYRYRGVSLSAEQPSASLSANFDFASGLYGGVSIARARVRLSGVRSQLVTYAGYARSLGGKLTLDAGVADTRYGGGSWYNHQEVYAGVSAERVAARMSVSPRYFGVRRRSVYTEIDGSYPLGDSVDLFAHAGLLRSGWSRMDYKVGVSAALETWTVQLAYVATRKQDLYPALAQEKTRRVVLTSTLAF